jgi:hypothetical protein
MADESNGTMRTFSLSNPSGPGQGDVPRLLRSLANNLEALGDVEVYDITFHSEPTEDENDLTFTVYYDYASGDEDL